MEISANGALSDAPGYYRELHLKASTEFFDVYKVEVLKQAAEMWEKDGLEVALHIWTFRKGDRQKNLCTLICFSDTAGIDQVIINAPADELQEVYLWVVQNNPHLYFMGEPKVGWVSDDFMRNTATMIDKFKIRSI